MPPPVFVQLDSETGPVRQDVTTSHKGHTQEDNLDGAASGAKYQVPPPYNEVYHQGPTGSNDFASMSSSTANIVLVMEEKVNLFSTKSIRIGFMRKVFGILSLQMLVTFGIIALFLLFQHQLEESLFKADGVFAYTLLAFVIVDLACIITVGCKPSFIRKTGVSFIFLAIITVCTAVFVGMVASLTKYKPAVFYAAGMTLTVVILLTLFTICQSFWELDFCSGFLLTTVGVIVAGVVLYFAVPLPESSGYRNGNAVWLLVIGGIVTVIFGMFWIWIVHKLVVDERSNPENYVSSSLFLYLGSMLIFLYLLIIFGMGENNGGNRGGMPICFWWWFPVWVDEPREERNPNV